MSKIIINRVMARIRLLPVKSVPFIPFAILVLPVIRLISPIILVRWGVIVVEAIGHFALNTELYLCEKDALDKRESGPKVLDLLYLQDAEASSSYLKEMWQRVINFYPASLIQSIEWLNNLIPGGKSHNIGANKNNDRDLDNLLANTEPHLFFTAEEELVGKEFLRSIGLEENSRFICLNVRDGAYYESVGKNNQRHSYRDSSIEDFILAAEELVNRGFYVIRMGRKVHGPLPSKRREIIDYAFLGMGNEFLDLYLGAKCFMCLSTGSGYDAIPAVFRRPVSFVNYVPIETPMSSENYIVFLGKAHISISTNEELSFKEIIDKNMAYKISTDCYRENGIYLRDNTPEQIRDVAIETVERLCGFRKVDEYAEELQSKFKKLMPLSMSDSMNRKMHGEFFIRYSESFLMQNEWWVE